MAKKPLTKKFLDKLLSTFKYQSSHLKGMEELKEKYTIVSGLNF